eukprot:scaffold21153_cov116-Isochrysis_galbana.AAC.8
MAIPFTLGSIHRRDKTTTGTAHTTTNNKNSRGQRMRAFNSSSAWNSPAPASHKYRMYGGHVTGLWAPSPVPYFHISSAGVFGGSPGFGVEARAHIEEKAFGVVGAAHVEGGYSPTAGAIWADMLTLAPPTAQKLRVTRGAATWASTAARRRRSAVRRYRWQPLDRRHRRGSPLASRRSACGWMA